MRGPRPRAIRVIPQRSGAALHIVGVTGARTGHPDVERWARRYVHVFGVPDLWVLGGARGVDTQMEDWCAELFQTYVVLYPLARTAAALKLRNLDMVAQVFLGKRRAFLGFPGPESRGTWHCLGAARGKGIQTYVSPVPTRGAGKESRR